MRHGFPLPILIADDAAPGVLAFERLRLSLYVAAFQAFAAGMAFKPHRAGQH
jgi:hypothetical protein